MTKDEFLHALEDMFALHPETIKETDTLDDLGVDSTGMLELVGFLAVKLGMKIEPGTILNIKTVGDVIRVAGDKIQ